MEKIIADIFLKKFGDDPLIVRSPGRINMIGEQLITMKGLFFLLQLTNSFMLLQVQGKMIQLSYMPRHLNKIIKAMYILLRQSIAMLFK